jgi:cytoskeleton protein RodZ
MSSLGASLKKARESRGISLDEIAADTRITTRFLTAIENEDFHLLPGGIFNRGFVRSYAEKVGLNPDQAVADYRRMSEVQETAAGSRTLNANPGAGDGRLYAVAVVLLALLIGIFYVATRKSGQGVQDASSLAVAQMASAQAAPEPEVSRSPAGTAIMIDIEASEPTWVRVVSDGNSVIQEILQPGTTRRASAKDALQISAGSAGGLNLKINGQTAKPLGRRGQVRSVRITPQNLKAFVD